MVSIAFMAPNTSFRFTHLTLLPCFPWRLFRMRLDIHAEAWRPHHYKVNYSPGHVIINNCQREESPKTTPWKEPQARQVGCSWVKQYSYSPWGDALLKARIMHGWEKRELQSHIFWMWKIKMSPSGAFKHSFTNELEVLEYGLAGAITLNTTSLSFSRYHCIVGKLLITALNSNGCRATRRNRVKNERNTNHQSQYVTSIFSGIHCGFYGDVLAGQPSSVLVKIQWVIKVRKHYQ